MSHRFLSELTFLCELDNSNEFIEHILSRRRLLLYFGLFINAMLFGSRNAFHIIGPIVRIILRSQGTCMVTGTRVLCNQCGRFIPV